MCACKFLLILSVCEYIFCACLYLLYLYICVCVYVVKMCMEISLLWRCICRSVILFSRVPIVYACQRRETKADWNKINDNTWRGGQWSCTKEEIGRQGDWRGEILTQEGYRNPKLEISAKKHLNYFSFFLSFWEWQIDFLILVYIT